MSDVTIAGWGDLTIPQLFDKLWYMVRHPKFRAKESSEHYAWYERDVGAAHISAFTDHVSTCSVVVYYGDGTMNIVRSKQPGEPYKYAIFAPIPVSLDKEFRKPHKWTCRACGRNKFNRIQPHKCVGGYRKRGWGKDNWVPTLDES